MNMPCARRDSFPCAWVQPAHLWPRRRTKRWRRCRHSFIFSAASKQPSAVSISTVLTESLPPSQLSTAAIDASLLSPMMRHYVSTKRSLVSRLSHRNIILLYRVGDFFESFFEDAHTLSSVCDLALTSKDAGKALGKRAPMAGLPHYVIDEKIKLLIKNHITVAVVDQVESSSDATPGSLVKRKITRLITPGTASDDTLLDPRHNSYLAALLLSNAQGKDTFAFCYADVSTGEFRVTETLHLEAIRRLLITVSPTELLLIQDQFDRTNIIEELSSCNIALISERPPLSDSNAEAVLCDFFQVDSVESLGCFQKPACVQVAAVLLTFSLQTFEQSNQALHLNRMVTFCATDNMILDTASLSNLEILQTSRVGDKKRSLQSAIDRTSSPMGARCLRSWLLNPLMQIDTIVARQTIVEALVRDQGVTGTHLQRSIASMPDFERLGGRVGSKRASPRELRRLCESIASMPHIVNELKECLHLCATDTSHPFTQEIIAPVDETLLKMLTKISNSLMDPAPASTASELAISSASLSKENWAYSSVKIFRAGYNEELDQLRKAVEEPNVWISEMEQAERERSGIDSLRIKHIKNVGYVLRISRSTGEKMVNDDALCFSKLGYHRVQGTKAELRYRFDKLKLKEKSHFSALAEAMLLELRLFRQQLNEISIHVDGIRQIGRQVAAIDVLIGFANLARTRRYCKPVILPSDRRTLKIEDGRHAVVEQTLAVGQTYVPNSFSLGNIDGDNDSDVVILCGPNAAGKSCALRSIGLIAVLAQIGSFVPAKCAEVSICDRIFTRVGAVDDVAVGHSTFQVEMAETASILSHATSSSIVLLDEIGRGTSSRDGMSIAWSVAEHLATGMQESLARTVFVTHYHELNYLADVYKNVKAFHLHMEPISENDDSAEMDASERRKGYGWMTTYKIVHGASFESMGLAIAQRAGFPESVLQRAEEIVDLLESPFQLLGQELKGILSTGYNENVVHTKVQAGDACPRNGSIVGRRNEPVTSDTYDKGFEDGYQHALHELQDKLDGMATKIHPSSAT